MNDKKMTGREVLEEAMRQYDMTYCDSFPPCEEEINLGREYDEKMSKLIKKSKNPFWHYMRKIGKMAAMLVLVLGVVMGVTVTSYGERKYMSDLYWSTDEWHPDMIVYRYSYDDDIDTPKYIETMFELTYIPRGYTLVEHRITKYGLKRISYWYQNENEENLWFKQEMLSHGFLVRSDADVEIIRVQDLEIVYLRGEDRTELFWANYGYTFTVTLTEAISEEECVKLIESVTKVREER